MSESLPKLPVSQSAPTEVGNAAASVMQPSNYGQANLFSLALPGNMGQSSNQGGTDQYGQMNGGGLYEAILRKNLFGGM